MEDKYCPAGKIRCKNECKYISNFSVWERCPYPSAQREIKEQKFGEGVAIIERLEAVQCILASACDAEEAKCGYDELDALIPEIEKQLEDGQREQTKPIQQGGFTRLDDNDGRGERALMKILINQHSACIEQLYHFHESIVNHNTKQIDFFNRMYKKWRERLRLVYNGHKELIEKQNKLEKQLNDLDGLSDAHKEQILDFGKRIKDLENGKTKKHKDLSDVIKEARGEITEDGLKNSINMLNKVSKKIRTDSTPDDTSLKETENRWDKASDEALQNFEKKLDPTLDTIEEVAEKISDYVDGIDACDRQKLIIQYFQDNNLRIIDKAEYDKLKKQSNKP